MSTATTEMIKRVKFNKNGIWIMVVLPIAIITGIAIADAKLVYFGVAFIPFLLYLCIHKPFIFPFGLYVFLIPFDSVLSLAGSTQGATLTKFLGVLTILVLSVKGALENKLIKPDFASIWWLLFLLYGGLTVFWAINREVVISQTLIGLLILYLVVASYKLKRNEIEALKWCIIAGGFFAALYTIYIYTSGGLEEIGKRATMVAKGNPSRYAFSLIIPFSISVKMMLDQNSKLIKGLIGGALSLIMFCIIITGSRGGMLGIGTVIIVYVFYTRQRINLVTILIVIAVILSSFLPSLFYERWQGAIETGGAGRTSIWYVGLLCLKKYWLIGAGLNNFPNAYNEFAIYAPHFKGYSRAPHNIYIGYFVQLGIIGFSLLIMSIIRHYQAIRSRLSSSNSNQIMLRASFWAVLVSSFFLDTVFMKSFWLLWMMIMMHRNVSEYK